jgi:hypothetical protein
VTRVKTQAHALAPKLLRGHTFPIRERLKKLGAAWDTDERGWWIPAENWKAAQALLHQQEDADRDRAELWEPWDDLDIHH